MFLSLLKILSVANASVVVANMRLRIFKLGVNGIRDVEARPNRLKLSHESYGVIVNDSLSTKLDCKSILTGEDPGALGLRSKDDQ